jgi:hypothetical protein
MNKIAIVSADCHVEELIWRDRPGITGDGFYGFQQLIDNAVKENLPLILAGDVVETLPQNTPTTKTVDFLQACISTMNSHGLKIYTINGQHDTAFPSWLKALDSSRSTVIDASNELLSVNGVNVFFHSYTHRSCISNILQSIPPNAEIFVSHQPWSEFMGDTYSHGRLADAPYVKMCISGDYHKAIYKYVQTADDREIAVLSPGATHIRKINEPSIHYAWLVSKSDKGDIYADEIKLNSRSVIRSTPVSEADICGIMQNAPKLAQRIKSNNYSKLSPTLIRPIWHVIDKSDTKNAHERLYTAINPYAELIYTPVRTKDSVDYEVGARYDSNDEICALDSALRAECGSNDDAYEFLSGLLNATDHEQFLKEYTCLS